LRAEYSVIEITRKVFALLLREMKAMFGALVMGAKTGGFRFVKHAAEMLPQAFQLLLELKYFSDML